MIYSFSHCIFLIFFQNIDLESLPSLVFTHHLSKLENLQLNGNHLRSLPASFSYLTAMKQLNLSNNRFLIIPQVIFNLTNLQLLDLSANQITQIKDDIELLEVDELNLNNNQVIVLLGSSYRYAFPFSLFRFLKSPLIYQNVNG